MEKELVSTIIPFYNAEKYMDRCIKSLLLQTYKNLEIILVNDGSTDGSFLIAQKYTENDNRIKIINKENGGLSSARNAGLDICKGNYVTFIDADDYVERDYIEELIKAQKKYDADIVVMNCKNVDEAGNVISTFNLDNQVMTKKMAFNKIGTYDNNNVIYSISCSKLFKKGIFNGLKYKEGVLHEDEFIIHYFYNNANTIACVEYPGYNYVQHNGTITKMMSIRRIDAFYAFYDRYVFFKKNDYDELARNTLRHSCLTIINLLEHISYIKNYLTYNKALAKLYAHPTIIGKYAIILQIKIIKNVLRPITNKRNISV